MAGKVADESGFPRSIGRSLGQPEPTVIVGRKRTRTQDPVEGDLVILPVNGGGELIVEAQSPVMEGLLRELLHEIKACRTHLEGLR